jgi:threonine/homoserine/homoserine lactone efflux protein
MPLSALLAWSALALAVTLAPGPDTLLVAGHAGRSGARGGLAATAGILCGGFYYAALCGFGAMAALAASPLLYAAAKIAGAAYLALIGAQMLWRALRGAGAAEGQAPPPPRLGAPFRQGFFTNMLNPKVALFYLAALPQFVGGGPAAPLYGVALIAIHYAMGALWLGSIALAAGQARRLRLSRAASRWLDGVLGAAFVGLAARLALDRR